MYLLAKTAGGADGGTAVILPVLIMLILGSFVGAMLLDLAVTLYNKCVDGNDALEKAHPLPFGHAYGIIFVGGIVIAFTRMMVGAILTERVDNPGTAIVAGIGLGVVVSLAIHTALINAFSENSFRQSLNIAIIYLIAFSLIVGGIVGMVVLSFPEYRNLIF